MFKHLDQKYFRYRADVVARAQAQLPDRAALLATSERMRLGFLGAGAFLFALVSGVLTVTATARIALLDWRTLTFFLITAFSAWVATRVFWALARSGAAGRRATGARSTT